MGTFSKSINTIRKKCCIYILGQMNKKIKLLDMKDALAPGLKKRWASWLVQKSANHCILFYLDFR